MRSRGGISGGLTIADALREFEARGYTSQFALRRGGSIECGQCGERASPRGLKVEAMRRIEGVSDPADMVYVGAVRCPDCDAKGTIVLPYGPQATPESANVLREIVDAREATTKADRHEDRSLVHDTGWLYGPDR